MKKIVTLSVLSLLSACAITPNAQSNCAVEDKAAIGTSRSAQIDPDFAKKNPDAALASEMDEVLAKRKADCHVL